MTEETNHSSDALEYGDTTLVCAKFRVSGYSLITHCDDNKYLKEFFFRPISFKWFSRY